MTPEPHRWPVRVYYEDTDAAGIVYYAGYLRFAERARTEMLRALGVGQEALRRADGLGFVVRRLKVDYHAPARLDDELVVETRVMRVAGAALTLEQQILRGKEILTMMLVKIGVVGANGRPRRLSPALLSRLGLAETQHRIPNHG